MGIRDLTLQGYSEVLKWMRSYPEQGRLEQERQLMPGPRQLTLWEAPARPSDAEQILDQPGGAQLQRSSRQVAHDDRQARRLHRHPWQHQLCIPKPVEFDVTSDFPEEVQAPEGWALLRRNGQLVICSPEGTTSHLEAAQAHMLEQSNQHMAQEAFLVALMRSCAAQRDQDNTRAVHWSRHLLAAVARATGARGLIGCSAVTRHPHFWWFSSPDAGDVALGSVEEWPREGCVLLLDAYPWEQHDALLRKAFGHADLVWVIRLAEPRAECQRDTQLLKSLRARLYARLPRASLIGHVSACWSEAKYDATPSLHPAEIWRLGRDSSLRPHLAPIAFTQALGDWKEWREDFHWPPEEHPVEWEHYRDGQQDRAQDEWEGLVAAIDGSVHRGEETMGAGIVVGVGKEPDQSLCYAVGGPLSSLRAEAAALHGLLSIIPGDAPLLVLTDCLALLLLMMRWGHADFSPSEDDVKHFDIIEPCIQMLRQRTGVTRFVKVKSHSGILLNERADVLAEQGRHKQEDLRWPGPRKLDRLRLSVRKCLRSLFGQAPSDLTPDKALVKWATEGAERLDAKKKQTIFTREILLDSENSSAVLGAIHTQRDSLVRLWMRTVSGLYPTATRLHQMFPARHTSAICQRCEMGQPETLRHFTTICPQYRAARTEAHNRCWNTIMKCIQRAVPRGWRFYHDQPMARTGLRMVYSRPSESAERQQAAIPGPQGGPDPRNLWMWRPDAVAINETLKKIAILEHSRPFEGEDREPDDGAASGGAPSTGEPNSEPLGGQAREASPSSRDRAEREGGDRPGEAARNPESRNRIRAAADRKRDKYQRIVDALHTNYGSRGWEVAVLPWVVGVRGVTDAAGIREAMEFLGIPSSQWSTILRKSAVASVEALEYLHKLRNSPQQFLPPELERTSVASGKRKRAGTTSTLERWRRLATDPVRRSFQDHRRTSTRQLGKRAHAGASRVRRGIG